jgi:hypothetical protein
MSRTARGHLSHQAEIIGAPPPAEIVNPGMHNGGPTLGADLLWGAASIAAELGLSVRKTFYLLENGLIPAQKIGGLWVASRSRLRQRFVEA